MGAGSSWITEARVPPANEVSFPEALLVLRLPPSSLAETRFHRGFPGAPLPRWTAGRTVRQECWESGCRFAPRVGPPVPGIGKCGRNGAKRRAVKGPETPRGKPREGSSREPEALV